MKGTPMRAFKDAFKGIFKNSIMSIASICILSACMLIMGSALLLIANLNAFVIQMQQQNEVVIFIEETATQEQITELGTQLENMQNISGITFVTKQEALEEYKSMFKDQSALFVNLEQNNPLRDSYHIKIADLELYSQTISEIEGMDHVGYIRGSSTLVNSLVSLRKSISLIGMWISIVLLCVSLFIISNTVRMAMFSRRTEINIMKYVGATDAFIRAPFVIEGLIIGLISCGLSFGIQWYVYTDLLRPLLEQLALFDTLAFESIWTYLLAAFALFSILMGVMGSILPMRKHLHV